MYENIRIIPIVRNARPGRPDAFSGPECHPDTGKAETPGCVLRMLIKRTAERRPPPGTLQTTNEAHTMTKHDHVKVLGYLHIARGVIVLLIGIAGFVVLTGIGAISGDSTALGVLGLIGTIGLALMGLLAVPSVIAGIGLLMRKEWGRILALVVGILSLIDIPLGTALGAYTIWVLMDAGGRQVFENPTPSPAMVVSPLPQA
jgi:hypothetical protein